MVQSIQPLHQPAKCLLYRGSNDELKWSVAQKNDMMKSSLEITESTEDEQLQNPWG